MSDIAQHLPEQSRTVEAIYAAYKKAGDTGQMSRTLSVSLIGHPCERYLWYCFRQCCKPEFDGRMYRLFETGNIEESRFEKNLCDIGCTVHVMDESRAFERTKQYKVTAFGGHLKGYLDAAILGLPEAPKTWHVGEFKTHNAKSFRELLKKGVKESKPQHHAQMQIYMHLTGMKRALYLARNKDTDELYSERGRYDKPEAEALMERAHRIISSPSPADRISKRRDFYQCGWCDAHPICWGTESPDPAISLLSLSCRQCCHATPVLDGEGAWWNCNSFKCIISEENSRCQCDRHLCLPGLIAFAEPEDYGQDENGNDWIDFSNNFDPGAAPLWRHGAGGYSSEELRKLPASLLTNQTMQDVKDIFKCTIRECTEDILGRYPASDSRIIWKGPVDSLDSAWMTAFNERLFSLTPIARDIDIDYNVIELKNGRIAILWPDQTAEIRQGVE